MESAVKILIAEWAIDLGQFFPVRPEERHHKVESLLLDDDAGELTRSLVRAGHAPRVMAALRNVAISALQLCGAENIAAACRRYGAPGVSSRGGRY